MNEQEFIQVNEEKLTDLTGIDTTVAANFSIAEDNLQRCPHCGESYYMQNFSTSTCVYYPPIYKDGVNINPDRNTTTVYCTCMNCKKEFSYQR